MKIDELILQLEYCKKSYGNILVVFYADPAGKGLYPVEAKNIIRDENFFVSYALVKQPDGTERDEIGIQNFPF